MTILATGKSDRPASPSAFTLIEVLLVLTLLAIVGAVAAPSMSAGMSRSRMNRAAEELRTRWAKARLEAAASGKVLCFQCRIGRSEASISSADDLSQAETTPNETGGAESITTRDSFKLDGVVFRQLLAASQPGDLAVGQGVGEDELSPAVLFRPDGSSSDAEALLEDENGLQTRVTLRGLTGASEIEDTLEAE